MSKLLLTTNLNQRLLMNHQLTQSITLLQYTTIEIKQQIKDLLEKNPLLEIEDEDTLSHEYSQQYLSAHVGIKNRSYDSADNDLINNVAAIQTLRDHLLQQTLNCHFNAVQQIIAEAIIDSIDDNGYLTADLDEIQQTIQTDKEVDGQMMLEILAAIQQFDPPGIAARTTKECLSLQLQMTENKTIHHEYAKMILCNDSLSLDKFDIRKIAKITQLSEEQLIEGLAVIKSLNFNPGKTIYNQDSVSIEPELYVKKSNEKWHVYLVDSILTRLNVNEQYRKLIKAHTRDKSYKSVLDQLNEAQLMINSIKHRNNTLLEVAKYIVETQQAFFNDGKISLKPLNMSTASAALECHESTISRITTGKYIATPHGLLELKYFFSSRVKTIEGDGKSSNAVKSLIESIVNNEDAKQAYSDDQLTLLLKKEGIDISRRTVTKYRESLNIPTSYQRAATNILGHQKR